MGTRKRGSFVLRSGAVAGRVPDKGNNTQRCRIGLGEWASGGHTRALSWRRSRGEQAVAETQQAQLQAAAGKLQAMQAVKKRAFQQQTWRLVVVARTGREREGRAAPCAGRD